MNQQSLNKMAKDIVEKYNLECPPEIRFIDLASEIGELGKELLKASNYGKNPITTTETKTQKNHPKPAKDQQGGVVFVHKESITSEIGDILFSLACIANTLDIDLTEAMTAAINKYHTRFKKSGQIGSTS